MSHFLLVYLIQTHFLVAREGKTGIFKPSQRWANPWVVPYGEYVLENLPKGGGFFWAARDPRNGNPVTFSQWSIFMRGISWAYIGSLTERRWSLTEWGWQWAPKIGKRESAKTGENFWADGWISAATICLPF